MKTLDLFDTIEDNSVQLQPHGVENMKKIEELTMQKLENARRIPVKQYRSLGRYLLAAVLVTLLLATSVFAYVGFTQYENPEEMMHIFFGDEALPSLENEEVFYPYPEGGGYTVLHPAAERVPLDEELVQQAAPIIAVGKTGMVNGSIVTVIAHQHDNTLGAGTVYYTVENPEGIQKYKTEQNMELVWDGIVQIDLGGAAAKHYVIPDQTTDTKLSVACYYVYDKWSSEWKDKNYVELYFNQVGFQKTSDPIALPVDIFEPANSQSSKAGELLLSSIGIEVNLEMLEFLYETWEDGTVHPPRDEFNIKYLAVQFDDGTEYIIKQDNSEKYINNYAYAVSYDDQETASKSATYVFNRMIDLDKAVSVIINDEEFPLSAVSACN